MVSLGGWRIKVGTSDVLSTLIIFGFTVVFTRYYEDDDIRASKLKGTLSLHGAKVVAQETHSTSNIINLLLSSGRNMKLEASSAKEALDWRNAFTETIAILELQRMSVKPAVRATRRFNLHDRLSAEQKKSATSKPSGRPSIGSVSPPPSSPSLHRGRSFSQSLGFGGSSPIQNSNSASPITPPPSSPSRLSRLLSRASISSPSIEVPGAVPVFKSPAVFDMLRNSLSEHFLLKHLSDLSPVIEVMKEQIVAAGEVVIWQGSSGDNFYVVEQAS